MQAKTEHFDDILKVNTNCTYNYFIHAWFQVAVATM